MLTSKLLLLCSFLLVLTGQASGELKPRWTPPKSTQTIVDPTCHSTALALKFSQSSQVRFRSGRLVSLANADLAPVESILARYDYLSLERLFSRPEECLDKERIEGEKRSGKELGDLNAYYRIRFESYERIAEMIDNLNGLDIVEIAYPIPNRYVVFEDIAPETPDLTEHQGYLEQAPEGIDARAAWDFQGGRGEGIRVVDFDGGTYRADHEDLKEPFFTIYGERMQDNYPHATAAIGILAAQHNGYGLDGICPEAEIGSVANPTVFNQGSDVADQINIIADTIGVGGIFFLITGSYNPNGESRIFEYYQANFDAVENATANGRLCFEASGNNNIDLGRMDEFDPDIRHSGAIFVGAGAPPGGAYGPDRSRLEFSAYGARVELQGWGEEVATTGVSNLFDGNNDPRQSYGNSFNGTSSATPMVAAAAACIQGIVKARSGGRETLDWQQMRDLLVSTGSPQQNGPNGNGHIGPRPNLAAAIRRLPVAPEWQDREDMVVSESQRIICNLIATDLNGDSLELTAFNLPERSSFIDRGGGHGTFNWQTDFVSAGEYAPVFVVSDGELTDTAVIRITVNNVNRPPFLNRIGQLEPPDSSALPESDSTRFVWSSASDPDDDRIIYTLLLEGYRDHFYFNAGSDTLREVRRGDLLSLMGDSLQAIHWRVMATDGFDTVFTESSFTLMPPLSAPNDPLQPTAFALFAFPNPFNSSVTISFTAGAQGLAPLRLAIFDISGRLVTDLTAAASPQAAGMHKVVWDASSVGAGIYFVRLETGAEVKTKKLLFIK